MMRGEGHGLFISPEAWSATGLFVGIRPKTPNPLHFFSSSGKWATKSGFLGVEEVASAFSYILVVFPTKILKSNDHVQVLAVWEGACVFGSPMRDCCKLAQVMVTVIITIKIISNACVQIIMEVPDIL